MKSDPFVSLNTVTVPAAAARSHRTCCLASSPIRLIKSTPKRFHRYWWGINQEMMPPRSFSMTNAPCSPPPTFLCPLSMTPMILDASRNKRRFRHLRDGGRAQLAIAILGWPVNQLAPEIANLVVKGGRDVCRNWFPIGRRRSIDAPEPLFGLAVTGLVESPSQTKRCF